MLEHISRTIKKIEAKPVLREAVILAAAAKVLGEGIKPISFLRGNLKIASSYSKIANLKLAEPQLIAEINKNIGQEKVRRLVIISEQL